MERQKMDFQTAIRTCFSKFATIQGRAARAEYWYFFLFYLIVIFAAGVLDAVLFRHNANGPLSTLVWLVLLLPWLAVAVRRLHDRDRSGWWLLLHVVPVVGQIVLIVWFCLPSTPGPNRFGPPPA
ncbi:DUF805 domain-containing protein [Geminicoccus flavidas]|uniref:DUF805 domain-containing protein n=1 Tax=Geminicoccus flavidas TaxID=2506407 RepID=UPI001F2184B8|nr:DUF805 domain-containing protein [Geminicoccus flavidas]